MNWTLDILKDFGNKNKRDCFKEIVEGEFLILFLQKFFNYRPFHNVGPTMSNSVSRQWRMTLYQLSTLIWTNKFIIISRVFLIILSWRWVIRDSHYLPIALLRIIQNIFCKAILPWCPPCKSETHIAIKIVFEMTSKKQLFFSITLDLLAHLMYSFPCAHTQTRYK